MLTDTGYPSKAIQTWLRSRGIAATMPEPTDQIEHRRKRPGRLIEFLEERQRRYRGRNVIERCLNRLKRWRRIMMRSDELSRSYRAASASASFLIRIKASLIRTTR